MKASFFISALIAGSSAVFAQSPVQEVIDNALIQSVNTNNQNIMSMLQQQLEEAQKQSQSLNDQLTRMGDPSKVTLPALELIKQSIAMSAQAAAKGAEREQRIRATTGAEAFGDNTYGLLPAVNATVTFKDGETGQRDPALYKLHGALMGDLNNVSDASTESDDRVTQLKQQLEVLLDQLSSATDVATAIKLQAAISTIQAEVASAQAEVTKAYVDHQVLTDQLKLQAQIEARAKAEARTMERKHNSDKAKAANTSASGSASSSGGASGASGTTTKPFSNLGWGSNK
jgi:hypothetical protein